MTPQSPPSCLLDAEQELGLLTVELELIVYDNAIGRRRLLALATANDQIKAAA